MSDIDLSKEELRFLRAAMLEWGGPSHPTDAIAKAMGFQDAETMSNQAWDFWLRIERGDVLAPDEWRSVLMAAEVVFSSDVVGSGLDWPITTGISDAESIAILRGLQRKLPRWRGSIQFNVTDAGIKLADPDRPQI